MSWCNIAANRPAALPLVGCFALLLSFAACDSDQAATEPASEPAVAFLDPVPDPGAAADAFRLFYRERVERAVLAYNRFAVFGDSVFATTIGRKTIARQGNEYEIVPGPTDNNLVGTTAFGVWYAYRIFHSRTLALSLVRLFNGLAFMEEVTGIPGLTVREALPGWTRVMDGNAGTIERTRLGAPVLHPWPLSAALESEILRTFYQGIRVTYREDPSEYTFAFKPVEELTDYAITYSIDERPRFLRVSNCCRSTMATPAGYPWAGAWWGNHNSRDNLPDLLLGILAAMEAVRDPAVDPEVREAALRAVEAGRRIGDLIGASDQNLMTVDEVHDYGDLTVSGAVRPHGDPENQDLGSMSACPMVYMARAVSSDGLDLPYPELPLPGEIEQMLLRDLLGIDIDLPIYSCHDVNDAYFGTSYATLLQSEPLGIPWLDLAECLDILSPGLAGDIIGSFQNDYDDIVEATAGVVHYARLSGKTELEEAARRALHDQTNLMRRFADVIYARTNPGERALQRYEAAVFDALGGITPVAEDFAGFALANQRLQSIENLLEPEETAAAPLKSDAEILSQVEAALAGEKLDSVVQRYRDTYGNTPPVRRNGDGYQARTSLDPVWRPVENPRHKIPAGDHKLLQEIPICVLAPEILDCTWAALGCAVADLDGNGGVDEADALRFEAAFAQFQGTPENGCRPANGWCGGADLDRTGELTALDREFMTAASGCATTPE